MEFIKSHLGIRHVRMAVVIWSALLLTAAANPPYVDLADRFGCDREIFERTFIASADFFDVPIDAKFALCKRIDRNYEDDAELLILDGEGYQKIEHFLDLSVLYLSRANLLEEKLWFIRWNDNLPDNRFSVDLYPPESISPEGRLHVQSFDLSPELAQRGVTRSMKQLVLNTGAGTSRRWYIQDGKWQTYGLH